MSSERAKRVEVANEFLAIISRHGRRFFHHEGRVSRFELDDQGRVWFVDKWKGTRIYTHRRVWSWGFSEGGTLQSLCIGLKKYIMGQDELPLWKLQGAASAPDPWGYGYAMEAVRSECRALAKVSP